MPRIYGSNKTEDLRLRLRFLAGSPVPESSAYQREPSAPTHSYVLCKSLDSSSLFPKLPHLGKRPYDYELEEPDAPRKKV